MNIKELIKSEKSVAFVEYMKKVIGINFYSQAYSNLMGFTINGERIQFKNYYELKEIPSDELLAEFLPEIESFKLLAQFWDKTLKSSLALGLKLDEKETRYFHVKFGGLTKFVIMPRPPALISILQERNPNAGMSYEYCEGKVVKKYYLYIENKNDIAKVLAVNKIKAEPSDLEQLECYYTDDKDFKVNLIYVRPPLSSPELAGLDKETRASYEEAAKFLLACKKPVWYIGVTKSLKVSIYWTTTDDKDFINNL